MAIELDDSTPTQQITPDPDHPLSSNSNNNNNNNDNANNDPPSLLTAAHTILTSHLLPPDTQSALLTTVLSHPYWTTFLLAQFLCSVVPLALFLFGAVVTASVAVAAFTCLAGLVLIPVLIGTTVLGVGVWGCGWVVVILGRWAWDAFGVPSGGQLGGVRSGSGLDGGVYGNGVQNGVQNGKNKDGGGE